MNEKRNYGRRRLPLSPPSQEDDLSYIANISGGGAFIKTNHLREVGCSMGMTIKLPLKGSPPLKANCIVRWVTSYGEESPWRGGMGVEFKDISSRSRDWIHRYVQMVALREKRQKSRATAKIVVDYQLKDQWETQVGASVSLGGIFIRSDQLLPQGSTLALRLYFPTQEEPIYTKGTVKWANGEIPSEMNQMVPQGMGIEFFSMKSADKKFISQYLTDLKREYSK